MSPRNEHLIMSPVGLFAYSNNSFFLYDCTSILEILELFKNTWTIDVSSMVRVWRIPFKEQGNRGCEAVGMVKGQIGMFKVQGV